MSARIAVLASGSGSNLSAILDHFRTRTQVAAIVLVISDRPDAGALARATRADVPARVIAFRGRGPADVAADLLREFDEHGVDLIALAGFLRLLPEPIVRAYRDRILNVHPSLLPAFGGRGMYGERVHAAVLAAGRDTTGVTVHYVDERYDQGKPLAQWPVSVHPDDDVRSLAARVLAVEHRLYPAVLDAVARGREPADIREEINEIMTAAERGAGHDAQSDP